jgi:GR25 family glycosyltransferase involved in LPS biosynthesis
MDNKLFLTAVCFLFISFMFYIYLMNRAEMFSTFLVSMDKDKDRRENILKNINIDDIYAVDGYTLDLEKLIEQGIVENKKLKKGEVGCYLSHVHYFKKALNSEIPVLVIEDDIKINKDILKKIDAVLKKAPKDYEILHIGFSYHESFDVNYKVERAKLVYGTHAYIINPKNIDENKVNNLFPLKEPIDMTLPKVFKSYIVWPRIVELDTKYSNISNTNRY